MATNTTCPTCTEPAATTCSGCHAIAYCSQECLETDLPAHHLVCASFAGVQQSPSNGVKMCRVVYFPPGAEKPQFLWLNDVESMLANVRQPDFGDLMGGRQASKGEMEIDNNAVTGIKLPYRIQLCYDENSLGNYATANKSMMAATNGQANLKWHGPLLAYCGRVGDDEDTEECSAIVETGDMDTLAYSHVIAHVIRPHLSDEQLVTGKIDAVKVLCDGALTANDAGRFKAVQLPRLHPALREGNGTVSPISAKIGMPLRLSKSYTTPNMDAKNNAVASMMVVIDPEADGLGSALPDWATDIGNVLVYRPSSTPVDRKELAVYHNFCNVIKTSISRGKSSPFTEYDIRSTVIRNIETHVTAEKWAAFREKW